MAHDTSQRRPAGGRSGLVWFDFLKLGALIAVDLVRPPRPENRLPKRWAPTLPPQ
ncbi:MAG: hypothetical protein WCY15_04070 [Phenylobacterium sp.]|jgi:hypothetical protein|uniref:hypothetical protein n=1 Tax=Phenylobacterium sp. TaxID=1871053 RepID=UPI002A371E9F|nr:hypothetical protein [Phenylobacterium sp.]MDX9998196.1 hypothetical protein [Phenylobacterium sp.]